MAGAMPEASMQHSVRGRAQPNACYTPAGQSVSFPAPRNFKYETPESVSFKPAPSGIFHTPDEGQASDGASSIDAEELEEVQELLAEKDEELAGESPASPLLMTYLTLQNLQCGDPNVTLMRDLS